MMSAELTGTKERGDRVHRKAGYTDILHNTVNSQFPFNAKPPSGRELASEAG